MLSRVQVYNRVQRDTVRVNGKLATKDTVDDKGAFLT